ncbi:DUF2238 domain-containing protein [Pseudomonas alabamensis]|uniref:DUF2238 domain-containing protein n=1 Tax=Pseudomonas alabamensis TaxID=3064349 RepID=UPI000745C63F|nr:DUF2238 domain-containing protein [Pseudomonas entomophila]AMA46383.1 hypothetical protein APT63_12550 [Pseudomonas monteilii]
MLSKTGFTCRQALFVGFAGVFILCGWAPLDRTTWLVENSLVLIGAVLAWMYRDYLALSTRAWAMIVAFLCLHEIGTHFTYPKVPYDALSLHWLNVSLDQTFGWPRNQYDRLVHLAYGLLLALPFRELLVARCALQGAWASLIAWSFILATSLLYELMEWIGGAYLGGGDSSFVGAQGDFWDAQKDMALATVGSLLVLMLRGRQIRAKASALFQHFHRST